MLLAELKVAKTPYASQRSIADYIDMYGARARKAQVVKTNDPAVNLAIWKSGNFQTFIVFPISTQGGAETIMGFVEFVWPEKLDQRRPWSKNVRTPHAGLQKEYQGRGIVKTIYRWFLDAGNILVTGGLQTPDSNALWRSLSRDYEVVFFNDQGEFIDHVTPKVAQAKTTRMALLGKGQTRDDIFRD
jgi:hypothetical protein